MEPVERTITGSSGCRAAHSLTTRTSATPAPPESAGACEGARNRENVAGSLWNVAAREGYDGRSTRIELNPRRRLRVKVDVLRGALMLACLMLGQGGAVGGEAVDLDTRLMLATVKLAGKESTGTAFLLVGKPKGDDAGKPAVFLVTAAHVLEHAKGEEATVFYHHKHDDGTYGKTAGKVTIRKGDQALWVKGADADVAVLAVTPPDGAAGLEVSWEKLARDEDLEDFEIHPGDAVRCVGFPHPNQFEWGAAGFGVVRVGGIASFPLRPTAKTKTFLVDLNTFEGDSGAPLYLVDERRMRSGKTEPARVGLILGVVVGQHFLDEEFKMAYTNGKFRHRMGLGIVVHASAVRRGA